MKANHPNPARKWCLLLAFCVLAPLAAQDDNEIVHLDRFEVRATISRYQWSYAKSDRFEILSSLRSTDLVADIVERAEQIIAIFEAGSPLFRKKNDLPTKLVFISDKGVERFFSRTKLQHRAKAYIPAPIGINDAKSNIVAATGYYDAEQIVLLKLITSRFRDDKTILAEAIDVAIAYLQTCLRPYIEPDRALWLETALDSARGHEGGRDNPYPKGFYSKIYGRGSMRSYSRPGWFAMDDKTIRLGRYCMACDIAMYRDADDFTDDYKTWGKFMTSPYINLGEVLESRDYRKELRGDMKTIDYRQTLLRQAIDFTYYCIFGPDIKDRAAFDNFVRSLKKLPPSEALFKRHFDVSHTEFHKKIYIFMRTLGRNDPEYKDNPWGPTSITIKHPAKGAPERVKLASSTRLITSRIVADWFLLCGAHDLAHQTLTNAARDLDPARADPEFVAALGLIEAEHGDRAKAVALLEKSTGANVIRPRAYRMLSQLRLGAMKSASGEDKRLTNEEMDSMVQPLLAALKQPWTNSQTHIQLAQIWRYTAVKPSKDILGVIALGCRQFPDDIDLLEEAIPLLASNGYPQAARQLLDHAKGQVLTDDEKVRVRQLAARMSKTEP